MRLFALGDAILEQVSGIPIVGPISSHVSDLCLAYLERHFDKNEWWAIARSVGLSGERAQFISTARYADDVMLVSRWFCADCLAGLVKAIHC